MLASLLEDARVELRAARELPGLTRLWAQFHAATPTDLATFPALCARLARALLGPGYSDPHSIVAKARELFFHPDHERTARPGGGRTPAAPSRWSRARRRRGATASGHSRLRRQP